MDEARKKLRICLLCIVIAAVIAGCIYYINEERKKVKLECLEKIHMSDKHKINLIVQKELHEGVLGILASHYTNQNGYPTFVLTDCTIESGQKAWKGSGRGVEELNLYDILSQVQDELSLIHI